MEQSDDRLLPSLTVRETIQYSALLRLPASVSKTRKIARAEEVLMSLGLRDCAETVIGNELIKGISGGEKRRVSIAVQLLNEPACLILDEPTSGLDAWAAWNVMALLKEISRTCCVVASIHQPRSDIYEFLDYVLLLSKGGKTVYSGPGAEMVPYFERLGYPCPSLVRVTIGSTYGSQI